MAIHFRDGVALPSSPAWQEDVSISNTKIPQATPGETIGPSTYWPGFHHDAVTDAAALRRSADDLVAAHKSLAGYKGDVDSNFSIHTPGKK